MFSRKLMEQCLEGVSNPPSRVRNYIDRMCEKGILHARNPRDYDVLRVELLSEVKSLLVCSEVLESASALVLTRMDARFLCTHVVLAADFLARRVSTEYLKYVPEADPTIDLTLVREKILQQAEKLHPDDPKGRLDVIMSHDLWDIAFLLPFPWVDQMLLTRLESKKQPLPTAEQSVMIAERRAALDATSAPFVFYTASAVTSAASAPPVSPH